MLLEPGLSFLTIENNLLIIQGSGAWNLNAIDRSENQASQDISSLYGKPWGVLLLLKGDSIFIPEAREKLTHIIKEDRLKGRRATALVLTECSVPNIVTEHLCSLYTGAGDEFCEFDDADSAKQWLAQQLDN